MFDKVTTLHKGGAEFVLYSPPDSMEITLLEGAARNLDFSETPPNQGYVIQPFDPGQPGILLEGTLWKAEWRPQGLSGKTGHGHEGYPGDREDFQVLVRKALERIRTGLMEKVVLSRCIPTTTRRPLPDLIRDVFTAYPQAFRFFHHTKRWGTWMGATPEVLCRRVPEGLETYSLAGTRQADQEFGVEWTDKEHEEQRKVTRYIEERLAQLGYPFVTGDTGDLRTGGLIHRLTRIKVETEGLGDFWKVARALHPTSAVGGMPLEEALDFIQRNEGYDRALYAGFQGEVGLDSRESAELYVSLRCLRLDGRQVSLYAGAGITEESLPEAEFEETEAKSRAMGRFL